MVSEFKNMTRKIQLEQREQTTHRVGNIAFLCSFQACKLSATLQNIGGTLDVTQIGSLFETGPSDFPCSEKLNSQSSFGGHTSLLSHLMAREMALVWQHDWNRGYVRVLVCSSWPQMHPPRGCPLLILWRGTLCQVKIWANHMIDSSQGRSKPVFFLFFKQRRKFT